MAEQHAIRDAREAKATKERAEYEEHSRRYSEHRTRLDEMVKAAKFKKEAVRVKLSDEASKEDLPASITSWVYKGLAVHRQVCANIDKAPYAITHVGSGLNFGFRFNTLYAAKTAVVRFVEVIVGGDYSLSPAEILANKSVTDLARAIRNTAQKPFDVHDPYVMVDVKVEEGK